MTNVTLEIRANGTLGIIDGYTKAKTTKGMLKDLNKEMIKLGYNDLDMAVNDKSMLQDEANYAESKESNPLEISACNYTYSIDEVEEGKYYISHSFVL